MKSEINYWITLVGLTAGGIAYWSQPYGQSTVLGMSIWLVMSIDALLGSFFLMIFLTCKPYIIATLVCLGVTLAILARIVYDTVFWDKTSHNLAPLEFIIGGIVTIPAAFVGAYLALLFKKLLPKNKIYKSRQRLKNNIPTFVAHPKTPIEKHLLSIDLKNIK